MSYFEDASLVLIPSAQKISKVYSIKPTDGSGDLTFTRSNDTATRVGPDGLIERVRTNNLLYSEAFDNTAQWGYAANGTITPNSIANPLDGALTADTYVVTDGSANREKTLVSGGSPFTFTAGNKYTVSAYYKAGTINSQFRILAYDGVSVQNSGTVDLVTIGNSTASYVSVGNGWYRFWYTFTAQSGAGLGYVYIVNYAYPTAITNGTNVYVYAAQLEATDFGPTPYIATTTAAVSVGPVANLPRLDYSGGASCPKLLLEPQRTNSATYSEQINNAAWNKLNVTVSANQAVSPDGTTSADLVYPTTTGTDRLIEQVISATIGQTWTSSFFVKASGFSWVSVYAPNLGTCWFNASTGVFGTIAGNVTATVLGQVNGYWRISFTGTIATSNAYFYAGPADANGTNNATTNGTNGLLFWGCQLEEGAYATSYVNTLNSAVTRGVDVCYKTGIGSLFGTNAGTIYFETIYDPATNLGGGERWVYAQGNTSSDYVRLWQDTTGGAKKIRALVVAGGVQYANIITNATSVGLSDTASSIIKFAFAYEDNRFQMYVNGINAGIDTSGTAPTITEINFNSTVQTIFPLAQCLVFPTALSDSDLAALTA